MNLAPEIFGISRLRQKELACLEVAAGRRRGSGEEGRLGEKKKMHSSETVGY